MSGITYIKRITGAANNLIYLETTDTTAAALAANYITAQTPNITAINDGVWTWEPDDCIMLSASDGISWCSIDAGFDTLIEFASSAISQLGLAGLGIYSAVYQNAGGSATITITDPNITANSIVVARWQSSANGVAIRTVAPSAGSLVVVSSADPGASVLEYISYTPSTKLAAAGVLVGKSNYAGGSATFSVAAPGVTSTMIVNANFVSQGTGAEIEKVTAGAGVLNIVASTNPGVSVVEYSAITPSAALLGIGLEAASYANAGGSATIAITDANITANSIVTADFSTQANASYVEKVTPSAGTLTIIANTDPGVSILDYTATSAASSGGSSTNGSFNRIVASTVTSSATPGTIRDIYGKVTDTATVVTSGNLVGVRGEVDMVGASGGFFYGTQGKVIVTGTLSGSEWTAGVFGQLDISAGTINAGQIAPIWGDYGATSGTLTDQTGTYGIAMTNTTAVVTQGQLYLYGGSQNLMYLETNVGLSGVTYFKTSGTGSGSWGNATPPTPSKVLKISVDGTAYYLPLVAQNT